MIDIDFMTEPLPGAELHTLLARLRAEGPVADIYEVFVAVLSQLLHAEHDGMRFTDTEVASHVLRCEPPVALLPRIAPRGGEIAGVAIPEGAVLRRTEHLQAAWDAP